MNAPKRFLRLPTVMDMVGRSRTTIYRDVQAGLFPAPVRIGARSIAWDSTEIERWQAERIAASAPAGPGSA